MVRLLTSGLQGSGTVIYPAMPGLPAEDLCLFSHIFLYENVAWVQFFAWPGGKLSPWKVLGGATWSLAHGASQAMGSQCVTPSRARLLKQTSPHNTLF